MFRRVLPICCFVIGSVVSWSQTTIHVPVDQPTIQAGIDAASNGDTVLVAPGTYHEQIDFKGKAITVTSGATSYADAANTVISAENVGTVVTFQSGEPLAATLNGFTLHHGNTADGTQYQGNGVDILNSSASVTNNVIEGHLGCGVMAYQALSLMLTGNRIAGIHETVRDTCVKGKALDLSYLPIYLYKGNTLTLNGNIVEDNHVLDMGGLEAFQTTSISMTSNIFRRNSGAAVGVGLAYAIEANFVQNLIYGNHVNGGRCGCGFGVSTYATAFGEPPAHIVVLNNTLFGDTGDLLDNNDGSEFDIVGQYVNSIVANNIIGTNTSDTVYRCFLEGPMLSGPTTAYSSISFRNNDVIGQQAPGTSCSTTPTDSGNISADPQFVSASTGDFRVNAGSPVIGVGDPTVTPLPAADLANKNRFTCGKIDMGAYEFHPAPPIQLTSSNNPAYGGTNVTFGAQLTGNCNVPTGNISFLDGSTTMGVGALNTTAYASYATTALTVGSHPITASYPGDFNFESSSGSLTQIVNGDPSATTLTVTPNPATAFSPVTMTATVTSPVTTIYGQPTGSVQFTANGVVVATATLSSAGVASATVSTLGAGVYRVVATYSADVHFGASASNPITLTVTGAASSLSLSSSANPAALTQPVTFTAKVSPAQGASVPSGTVTFSEGATVLQTANLNASGVAVFTTSSLSLGQHLVTASYGGSADFSSSSAFITETIQNIATTLTLTATPNPANTGQAVVLTAHAASGLAGSIPSGTVQFFDGATLLGTVSLDANGNASFTATSLAVGTHLLHATLPVGPTFSGSESNTVTETVLAYDFTLALSAPGITLQSGNWAVVHLLVTPVGGFKGNVAVSCRNLPIHSQCELSANTVSLATGAQTVELTVNTSDIFKFGHQASRGQAPFESGAPAFLALFLAPLACLARRRGRLRQLSLVVLLAYCFVAMVGCTGKEPEDTPPGTYNLSIPAQDAATGSGLSHVLPLALVVTK